MEYHLHTPHTMKGNPFLGFARKKLGDIVLYRAEGEQIARARNRNPRNPKSAKQAVQRMILATAAKMASAYEPIVNHSFEGTAVGNASMREFRSRAMNQLRSVASDYINSGTSGTDGGDFAIKGAPVVGVVGNLQVSRGSLGMNAFDCAADAVSIVLPSAIGSSTITTDDEYKAVLAKLGIEPGDQLTFVTSLVNTEVVVASATVDGETIENHAQMVRFCRVVLVSQLPDSFSGTFFVGSSINPALIQEYYGNLPTFSESSGQGGFFLNCSFGSILPADTHVQLGGVIRSQKQENGSFKYSSCYLKGNADYFDYNNANEVYKTYMDGVTDINVGDTLYLRHAVAASF